MADRFPPLHVVKSKPPISIDFDWLLDCELGRRYRAYIDFMDEDFRRRPPFPENYTEEWNQEMDRLVARITEFKPTSPRDALVMLIFGLESTLCDCIDDEHSDADMPITMALNRVAIYLEEMLGIDFDQMQHRPKPRRRPAA